MTSITSGPKNVKHSLSQCSVCKTIETSKEIKKCALCHITPYCSKACQREDWPAHQVTCQPRADKQPAAGAGAGAGASAISESADAKETVEVTNKTTNRQITVTVHLHELIQFQQTFFISKYVTAKADQPELGIKQDKLDHFSLQKEALVKAIWHHIENIEAGSVKAYEISLRLKFFNNIEPFVKKLCHGGIRVGSTLKAVKIETASNTTILHPIETAASVGKALEVISARSSELSASKPIDFLDSWEKLINDAFNNLIVESVAIHFTTDTPEEESFQRKWVLLKKGSRDFPENLTQRPSFKGVETAITNSLDDLSKLKQLVATFFAIRDRMVQ